MINKIINKCLKDFIGVEDFIIESRIREYIKILNIEKSDAKLKCGTRCFVMAIILIKRFIANRCAINIKNINDIIVVSMILSFKMTEDDTYNNIFLNTFKITSKKLYKLEVDFLKSINYKLYISNIEYNKTVIDILSPLVAK